MDVRFNTGVIIESTQAEYTHSKWFYWKVLLCNKAPAEHNQLEIVKSPLMMVMGGQVEVRWQCSQQCNVSNGRGLLLFGRPKSWLLPWVEWVISVNAFGVDIKKHTHKRTHGSFAESWSPPGGWLQSWAINATSSILVDRTWIQTIWSHNVFLSFYLCTFHIDVTVGFNHLFDAIKKGEKHHDWQLRLTRDWSILWLHPSIATLQNGSFRIRNISASFLDSWMNRSQRILLTLVQPWDWLKMYIFQYFTTPQLLDLLPIHFMFPFGGTTTTTSVYELWFPVSATLELDNVGASTSKWYLLGFGLEYCQSEWARGSTWDVV